MCELYREVAYKHPETKFIQTIATKCVPNFLDKDVPALFFYQNGELTGNLIPCSLVLGGIRMTTEIIEFVLHEHKQIECEFEEDPRDKLKLLNTIVKRGEAAKHERHEKEVDSDEDGLDDREYADNQYY